MSFSKKQIDQLLNSGAFLGKSPLFEVGDKVKYRVASYREVGFFDCSIGNSIDVTLEVLSISRQVMIGLPVMDLVWEYMVIEIPLTAKSYCFYLLEPQLNKAAT